MGILLAAETYGLSGIERAGLNTLLGMGMAFFVLIVIMLVIMLFPLFFGQKKKKPAQVRAELAEKAIDNTISQIEEHEALTDDGELIAVIAAAIAASEGAGSTEGLVIRSIKQRANKKKWQRA